MCDLTSTFCLTSVILIKFFLLSLNRIQSLPSSCLPSCFGRSLCSCPSSSTTQPSSSPTGPGTHLLSPTTLRSPLKWKCLSSASSNEPFMCSYLSSSFLSTLSTFFFFISIASLFHPLALFTLSPLSLPLSAGLPALLFWAGCHRDLHVGIMICTVVTVRWGAEQLCIRIQPHAAPMSTLSLHNLPHKCAGVMCEGPNANQLFTGVKSVVCANEHSRPTEFSDFTLHYWRMCNLLCRYILRLCVHGTVMPLCSLSYRFDVFFVLFRSGENQVTMHKCFLLLVFMVIILPSLGLSR